MCGSWARSCLTRPTSRLPSPSRSTGGRARHKTAQHQPVGMRHGQNSPSKGGPAQIQSVNTCDANIDSLFRFLLDPRSGSIRCRRPWSGSVRGGTSRSSRSSMLIRSRTSPAADGGIRNEPTLATRHRQPAARRAVRPRPPRGPGLPSSSVHSCTKTALPSRHNIRKGRRPTSGLPPAARDRGPPASSSTQPNRSSADPADPATPARGRDGTDRGRPACETTSATRSSGADQHILFEHPRE